MKMDQEMDRTENKEVMKRKRVLVVGAGGFAGGFIVSEGLRRGYEVWAGVRATTSRKWLVDPEIRFLELDMEKPDVLVKAMTKALPEGERWDYIIYNLGATKALHYRDFDRINYSYLRNFEEALRKADKYPDKFYYMSSLSAMGPGDEKGYTPYTEKMIPNPNTRYGASKLKAEMWLASSELPYIIFRATGVYGPRDHDYFLMFKSISRGFDFSVGLRKQLLSFIYVEDLARAIYDALERAPLRETYIVAEPRSYTQKEFRRISMKHTGRRIVIPMRMPLFAVKAVSAVAEFLGVLRMKPSTLNRDKYNIMKQRNWSADINKAVEGFGFNPQVSLEEGVERSIRWYRENKWL